MRSAASAVQVENDFSLWPLWLHVSVRQRTIGLILAPRGSRSGTRSSSSLKESRSAEKHGGWCRYEVRCAYGRIIRVIRMSCGSQEHVLLTPSPSPPIAAHTCVSVGTLSDADWFDRLWDLIHAAMAISPILDLSLSRKSITPFITWSPVHTHCPFSLSSGLLAQLPEADQINIKSILTTPISYPSDWMLSRNQPSSE